MCSSTCAGPRTRSRTGVVLGVGTVLTGEQAAAAITRAPGSSSRPGPRRGRRRGGGTVGAGVPRRLHTDRSAQAVDLGSAAVKIFPAKRLGPKYPFRSAGPYPKVELLPSGGINPGNAQSYLDAGAMAVCAGTCVVPPAEVAAGNWADITDRARNFVAAITP